MHRAAEAARRRFLKMPAPEAWGMAAQLGPVKSMPGCTIHITRFPPPRRAAPKYSEDKFKTLSILVLARGREKG